MKQGNRQTPDYGNWVPRKMLFVLGTMTAACVAAALFVPVIALQILLGVDAALGAAFLAYFSRAYYEFSYNGGGLSGKILDMILSHIQWDCAGTILDIGCGSGALAVKLAKKFPAAKITGFDYWGAEWDFNPEQCRRNALLEGVADAITFLNGSASKLPFEDESFDAAVSNFVFHEVKDTKNKSDLVKEALRIVKKGGCFVFHDLFYVKNIYGNIEEILAGLRAQGVSEIHITDTSGLEIIPRFLRSSFMLGGIGLVYGKK